MEGNGFINVRDFGALGSGCTVELEATSGSSVFRALDVGDFSVGDTVLLFGGVPRVANSHIYARTDTSAVNPRPPKRRYEVKDELELVGYKGPEAVIYTVDIYPEEPDVIRWTKDNGQSWVEGVPIVNGEAAIENGIKLIIHDFEDKKYGCTAVFACESKRETKILSISGNEIELSVVATVGERCRLAHSDSVAFQRAVDLAIERGGTVYIPNGEYKLTSSVVIKDAENVQIIGESGAGVIIRNSDMPYTFSVDNHTSGPCFKVLNSRNVTFKSFTMIGSMGYAERMLGGCNKSTKGVEPTKVYGFYYSYTSAITFSGVERAHVEDVHARRMSGEAFYSSGAGRIYNASGECEIPDLYQKSINYVNCTAEDLARNAFNNNDRGEGTTVTGCRIVDVGGCAWEGASRFVKITNNYIRNAGPVAIGNVRSRSEEYELLGTAQHIVADNYFEGGICYGGAGVTVGAAASQVIIRNNMFVNFNSNAILIVPHTQHSDLPPEHVIVTGNSIDLTAIGTPSEKRYGIRVGCDYATVSDNQIYTRGPLADDNTSGIELVENSVNSVIHSNTCANCGRGISALLARGVVGPVKDEREFYREEPLYGLPGLPPMPRRRSHRFAGWIIEWDSGGSSEIEIFDAETKLITLKEPRKMVSGEKFTLFPPTPSAVIRSNILSKNRAAIVFEGGCEGRILCSDNLVI